MKKIKLSSEATTGTKKIPSDDRAKSSLCASSLHERSSDALNFLQATRQGYYSY